MATELKVICDWCGSVVLDGRTLLKVESGALRAAGREALDLCRDCGDRLTDFLKTPDPAAAPVPTAAA